jgi:hypothetical protein
MKKILFAAFAASLLAAGCQKTEVYQPANSGEKMTFSTEMKKITKAEGDPNEGTLSLQGQGFMLWAYAAYSTENIFNVDTTNRIYDAMAGMELEYDNGWGPSEAKDYYWPGADKNLRFFAVSSNTVESTGVEIAHGITEGTDHTITTTNPSMNISEYTVTSTGDDDLMVADFLHQNQGQNSRVVELNFHHALSKVEFFFKATKPDNYTGELEVYVQKLTVKDVLTTGSLSVSPKANQTSNQWVIPVELSWGKDKSDAADFVQTSTTAYSGSASDIESISYATRIDPETTPSEPLSFAKWLMLPQTITNKLVEIIYVIGDRQFKATFKLDGSTSSEAATLSSWEINKYIKYTINLSPNMITFDANVETDWENETGIDHIN